MRNFLHIAIASMSSSSVPQHSWTPKKIDKKDAKKRQKKKRLKKHRKLMKRRAKK